MKELALTRSELEALVAALAQEMLDRGPSAGGGPAPVADASLMDRSPDLARLASLFDHTLLKAEATAAQVEKACEEAMALGCATLVVQPTWVTLAARRLGGSAVRAATVVGFPFGAELISAKRAQAEAAVRAGAREIDMVMNIGAFLSGDLLRVELDIQAVAEICHAAQVKVKVILENAFLTHEQKAEACRVAKKAGADFVKTSTGVGPSGANEADVRLMREVVGLEMGVKAAGGIRTLADALRMLQAGANRLGTSATVSILAEAAAFAD